MIDIVYLEHIAENHYKFYLMEIIKKYTEDDSSNRVIPKPNFLLLIRHGVIQCVGRTLEPIVFSTYQEANIYRQKLQAQKIKKGYILCTEKKIKEMLGQAYYKKDIQAKIADVQRFNDLLEEDQKVLDLRTAPEYSEPDSSSLMWWAYLHSDGSIHIKRWYPDPRLDHLDDLAYCQREFAAGQEPFVKRIVNEPFVANDFDHATRVAKTLLNDYNTSIDITQQDRFATIIEE